MNDEITPLQRFRRTYRDNRTSLATQAAANRSAPRSHQLDPQDRPAYGPNLTDTGHRGPPSCWETG